MAASPVYFRIAKTMFWGYWVALFTLTHIPVVPKLVVYPGDKVAHLMAYALLMLMAVLSNSWPDMSRSQQAWRWSGILALYAGADELTQPIVGRSAERMDFLADVAGLVAMAVLISAVVTMNARLRMNRR